MSTSFLSLSVFPDAEGESQGKRKISAGMQYFYFLAIFRFCVRKTFSVKLLDDLREKN